MWKMRQKLAVNLRHSSEGFKVCTHSWRGGGEGCMLGSKCWGCPSGLVVVVVLVAPPWALSLLWYSHDSQYSYNNIAIQFSCEHWCSNWRPLFLLVLFIVSKIAHSGGKLVHYLWPTYRLCHKWNENTL